LRAQTCNTAEVFHFHFERYCSWAIFIIDEVLGVFAICSDYGNWTYRWNIGHIGAPSLKAFICKADEYYLTGKLAQGVPHVWSPEGTQKFMREIFDERMKELSEEEAVEQRKLFEAAIQDADWNEGPELFATNAPEFLQETFELIYECYIYEPPSEVLALRDHLLPFFRKWLKEWMTKEKT